MFIASTTITILNETRALNEYGDAIDAYQAVKTGVPAHIWEEEHTAGEPVDNSLHTYRRLVGMIPNDTDIQNGDRIKDEANGYVYNVTHVLERRSFVGKLPLKIDLEIVK